MESLKNLRTRLEKLKDKEAKLMADLAIRENPELESAIIQIIIRVHDLSKCISLLKSVEKPSDLNGQDRQIHTLQNQYDFHMRKAQAIKDVLDKYVKGENKRFYQLQADKNNKLHDLKTCVEKVSSEYPAFNLKRLLPLAYDLVNEID